MSLKKGVRVLLTVLIFVVGFPTLALPVTNWVLTKSFSWYWWNWVGLALMAILVVIRDEAFAEKKGDDSQREPKDPSA